MKRTTICLLASLFVTMSALAQLKPIGFIEEVITPKNDYYDYYPRLHLIDDVLYVPSNSGLYKKDLTQDGDFELYAFEGIPIIQFVKNGDKLLAISLGNKDKNDEFMFLSEDDGENFINLSPSYFFGPDGWNQLYLVAQNPEDPNTVIVASAFHSLSISYDFGQNWSSADGGGSMFWSFLSFHPLSPTAIFVAGENGFMDGYIYSSYDSGDTWRSYHMLHDNCINYIDFHPADPDILIYSANGFIGKSTDMGITWEETDFGGLGDGPRFLKILFNQDNPNIIYALGDYWGETDDLLVYRSTDMGESWHLAYEESFDEDCGNIIDMVKYKNKLIFYTTKCGLYELEVESPVTIQSPQITPSLVVYPNPVRDILYYQSDIPILQVDIMDVAGRLVMSKKENSIHVSGLETGIYIVVFHTKEHKINRKIYIE